MAMQYTHTGRCLSLPQPLRLLIGGKVVGGELDLLHLQHAQDVFCTPSAQIHYRNALELYPAAA